MVKYYRRYIRICILFYRTETMEEILEEQAEQLYPLKEKAECHVAFMQGAKFGHDKGVTIGVNAIMDKLITACNNGKISVGEMTKIIELLKK